MHGMERFNLTHTYDALNRLTRTVGDRGHGTRTYQYDSLGNMIFETHSQGNRSSEYWHNSLNQQVRKLDDGKDSYDFSFDLRGNLVQGVYHQNRNHSYIIEAYVYDATNRMVKGINVEGEESHYIYNGLGHLVANEWVIEKNNYGYTGVETDPSERVGGVVICDRHTNSTGQGHINPTGKGHTTGGTTGGSIPTIHNKFAIVHKDYVLDYTSPLANVIMEYESGASGLTYRYTYGLQKNSAVVYGIPNGVGSVVQNFTYPGGTERVVKLYYHHDRLGSTHYLTDNVDAKVTSFTAYDDWGAPTMKAVLRLGERELDLVAEYTGHPYDPIMGIYYAKARMYDAEDRRFMAVDPIQDGQNWYLYCENNPIIFTDPTGLYLVGMIISEGAKGTNAYRINEALVKKGYITGRQSREMNMQNYSSLTTAAVKRFQRDNNLAETGNVNNATWLGLDLDINTTLAQEFFRGVRGNSTISVSVSGDRITITYNPKVHIRKEYYVKIECVYRKSRETQPVDVRLSVDLHHSDPEYQAVLQKIDEGFKLWGGSYQIYTINATVNVFVNFTHASSRLDANLEIRNDHEYYSMVPTTAAWQRTTTPIMKLNLGDGGYWNNGIPTVRVTRIAAHEFGHVLGVFDAYRYLPWNPTAACTTKAPTNGIMRSDLANVPAITSTEILMMLYAFSRNTLQTYEHTLFGGEVSNAFFH